MQNQKAELLRRLIAAGRAPDLLEIIEGTSVYTSENSEGAPRDQRLGRLWTAAVYHLRFVSEFGNRAEGLMKDGKWLCPFPREFSEWLEAGSPGISEGDLKRYLCDHPLGGMGSETF